MEVKIQNNIEAFFTAIGENYDRMEALYRGIAPSLSAICTGCHVAKLESSTIMPASRIRPESVNRRDTIFQTGEVPGQDVLTITYRTKDGGSVDCIFYPRAQHSFTPEEAQTLRIIGREIYTAGSRIQMLALLDYVVLTDLAVGIPNKEAFQRHLGRSIAMEKLAEYEALFFNTKNFKYVNKELAYSQGDQVMRLYSQKIFQFCRPELGETAARLGGDNFVALIRKERMPAYIDFLQNVYVKFEDEHVTKEFTLGASIGHATLENVAHPGEVMHRISVAAYVAKKKRSEKFISFSPEVLRSLMQEKEISILFRQALEKQEFMILLQPKVQTKDHLLIGAEALVRWKREDTLIAPGEFLPILEQEGSICALDFYVLEKTCQQLRAWQDAGYPLVTVSTNFSKRHLQNEHLAADILAIVDRYQLPYHLIEVEFTESEDHKDYQRLSSIVKELHTHGIRCAMDDFGMGYSSLNLLKNVPFDVLKIDKSFIPRQQSTNGPNIDELMFSHILSLARDIGMATIVEGIEDEEQLLYIRRMGCDMVQGFYFDRPLHPEDFLHRLLSPQYPLILEHDFHAPLSSIKQLQNGLLHEKIV